MSQTIAHRNFITIGATFTKNVLELHLDSRKELKKFASLIRLAVVAHFCG